LNWFIFFQPNRMNNFRLARNIEWITRSALPTLYLLFVLIYFFVCFMARGTPHN
jgi:hypothetical protein